MCVLALAWKSHPRWRLVMAGNRDELHSRPSAPLARWEGTSGILAGRDLLSGGTWAGVSEAGRFVVVTNRTGYGPPDPALASRGALVEGLLTHEGPYARPSPSDLDGFNPFNLISLDGDRVVFRSNRPEPVEMDLAPGVHGLTNGDFTDVWPRSRAVKSAVEVWLAGPADRPETLFDGLLEGRDLAMPTPSPEHPLNPEQIPVFIRNSHYGSRCSTVVVVTTEGEGLIAERRFDSEGRLSGETALRFAWPTLDGLA